MSRASYLSFVSNSVTGTKVGGIFFVASPPLTALTLFMPWNCACKLAALSPSDHCPTSNTCRPLQTLCAQGAEASFDPLDSHKVEAMDK